MLHFLGWEAEELWVEDVGQCADVNGNTITTNFNYRIKDLVAGQRPEATAGNRQECFAKCDAMNKDVPLQGCVWDPWSYDKNCIMYTVEAYKGQIAKGSGSTGTVNYYCYFRKGNLYCILINMDPAKIKRLSLELDYIF